MIKKRTRPQTRVRATSTEQDDEPQVAQDEEEAGLPLADILELRKLRKAREGIDVAKLNKGEVKKRRRSPEPAGGLVKVGHHDEEEEGENEETRVRRVVRKTNFTQQTNALDTDKHMMAYIEENLKVRSKPREDGSQKPKPVDPQEELYNIADRWKFEKQKLTTDVGSVSNSMTMLTAIPEVDLGMDTRLKNIEETEKAKRILAEERKDRKKPNHDEDHLLATRFYRPSLKPKSDADILRDAKLEALGLPQNHSPPRPSEPRNHMATDEMVMERFKKRMRK